MRHFKLAALVISLLLFTGTASFSSPAYANSARTHNCSGTWVWKNQTSSVPRYWNLIASSSDNRRLIVSTTDGYLFSSSDYGATWTNRTPNGANPSISQWSSLVSSSDGRRIVAVNFLGSGSQQGVFTSSDFGVTWKVRTLSLAPAYWSIATQSDDGSRLVASDVDGNVYTSTNNGANWIKSSYSGPALVAMTSSSNGKNLAAVVNGGYVITSSNYGATWSQQPATAALSLTPSISGSSDGSHLIASSFGSEGKIYTSSDFGVTWTERPSAGSRYWSAVASNGDGSRLVAAASNARNFFDYGEIPGSLFISSDFGATWTEIISAESRLWKNVVISRDGSRITANVLNGDIYLGSQSRRR